MRSAAVCGNALRWLAVAFAMQNAEKFSPWPNLFAILAGHDARDLVQVREIVRRPRGQQLRQCDLTQRRMTAALLEIVLLQIERSQLGKFFAALAPELIQQLRERFWLAPALKTLPPETISIERLKWKSVSELENVFHARQPVHAVRVDEMCNHVQHIPGILTLVRMRPHLRQIAQQRIECSGRGDQQCECVFEIVLLHFPSNDNNGLKTRVFRPLPVNCWDWTEAIAFQASARAVAEIPPSGLIWSQRRNASGLSHLT